MGGQCEAKEVYCILIRELWFHAFGGIQAEVRGCCVKIAQGSSYSDRASPIASTFHDMP